MIIALTGGIASGKSTVSHLFNQLGIDIIDTDLIARQVVQPGQPGWFAITQHFGDTILQPDQHIDRIRLRDFIFQDDAERAWLDHTLHPLIRQRAKQAIHASHPPYCLLVIPLLDQNTQAYYPPFARILLVDLPEAIQLERLQTRDHPDKTLAQKMIASQPARQTRLGLADDIIDNTGSQRQLEKAVAELHRQYCSLSNLQCPDEACNS